MWVRGEGRGPRPNKAIWVGDVTRGSGRAAVRCGRSRRQNTDDAVSVALVGVDVGVCVASLSRSVSAVSECSETAIWAVSMCTVFG